jgi:hypothetical protein
MMEAVSLSSSEDRSPRSTACVKELENLCWHGYEQVAHLSSDYFLEVGYAPL